MAQRLLFLEPSALVHTTPCPYSLPLPLPLPLPCPALPLSPCPLAQIRGKVSAVVDGLWFVFWLAAAALTTNLLTDSDTNNSRTRASCAFCWITW